MNGRIPYSAALDGLRGVAVLLVLAFHGEVPWLGGGYLGVSTFFTLSGFLITSLLLIEREGRARIDLGEFWARRLRRLMPAALAGIALVAVYARFAAEPRQITDLRLDAAAAFLYVANFRFMALGDSYWDMFRSPSPLQHYWSLSIEEQFYVVYPLLLVAIYAIASRPRSTLRAVLLALVLLSTTLMVGLAWSGSSPSRLYYGTDTRACEFLVGALLSTLLVVEGRIRPWRGRGFHIATLVAAAFVLALVPLVEEDSAFLYRGGFALHATATGVLINAALQPSLVRALLSLEPLVWLGRISYGAYIYHWPIYLWLDHERSGLDGAPLFLLRVLSTLSLAAISYRFLEQPIRSGRFLAGARALIAGPATAALLLASFLLIPASAPHAIRGGSSNAIPREPMPALGPRTPDGPVRVMVLGDSIAWTVGSGFKLWAARSRGRAIVWNLAAWGHGLGRGGEQPTLVGSRIRARRWQNWPARWEADVRRFQPDIVVILSGMWDIGDRKLPGGTELRAPGDPDFDAWLLSEYQLAVDIASAHGARVVWLTSPCVGPPGRWNPLRKNGALEPERLAHLNQVLLPRLVASRPGQVETFDLFAALCPGGQYVKTDPRLGDLRTDEHHISRAAATRIAGQIFWRMAPRRAAITSREKVAQHSP